MKRLPIMILAVAMLASCSKSKTGGPGSSGSTACVCTFVYRPVRDTTVVYQMDPTSSISVDSQCRFQSAAVKQTYGNGSCSL